MFFDGTKVTHITDILRIFDKILIALTLRYLINLETPFTHNQIALLNNFTSANFFEKLTKQNFKLKLHRYLKFAETYYLQTKNNDKNRPDHCS